MHPESLIYAEREERRGYPLHIHIASLFSVLILVSGVTIGWFNYVQTERIVLEAADRVFDKLYAEVTADLAASARLNHTTVEMLAAAPVNRATTLEERHASLPVFHEALRRNDRINSLYIGYDDGEMYFVLPLRTESKRRHYKAPENASYMVWSIDHRVTGERESIRFFYDDALNLLSEKPVGGERPYDPRTRPWYAAALQATGLTVTAPYPFFDDGTIGATVARHGHAGRGVVAADIRLDRFSEILAGYEISPSAEVAILNDIGEVLAYSDVDALIKTDDGQETSSGLLPVAALGVPILEHVVDLSPDDTHTSSFEWGGLRWKGGLRELPMPEARPLYLAMAAPEEELVAEASRLRWQSLLLTLAMLLATIPLAWLMSRLLSRPLRILAAEARSIQSFDFRNPVTMRSVILEIDRLAGAMDGMKRTVRNFQEMSADLSAERRFTRLLSRVREESCTVSGAKASILYLLNKEGDMLIPAERETAIDLDDHDPPQLRPVSLKGNDIDTTGFERSVRDGKTVDFKLNADQATAVGLPGSGLDTIACITAVPLKSPTGQAVGLLCLIFHAGSADECAAPSAERRAFVEALAGVAATAIDNQRLVKAQKDLLAAFIKLVAGAIDAKSPYTGGHCQRVPALTRMLAQAACDSDAEPFRDFSLSEEGWEELDTASWLHDCGKVTTPEYVVDKATKLQTIYDRLNEVRMRFEVLKRDAETAFWKQVSEGGNETELHAALIKQHRDLDEEFAFVAECNLGGEFMAPEQIERLEEIGQRTWTRTLDDRLGVSWEERARKDRSMPAALPVEEKLLSDKDEHIIHRADNMRLAPDNPWGFKLEQPDHLYNLGELYNLSVRRGTLTAEERYVINDHIVQTIIMLSHLPFPKNYARVVEYAGGHHEKMDGTGYPCRKTRSDMSLPARIMAIADIFEALTAGDRPYKKAKPISEAVRIMGFMCKDSHIDAELFTLFLTSGVYLKYARRFLNPDQIDSVDINAVLAAARS